MTNDTAYYLAFQKIGIGYRTLHNLLERFSSPDRAWNAPREELMRADASTLFIEKFIAERNLIDVEKLYAQSKFSDALPLTVADPRYPALLLETHSPPLVLFVRGSIDALNTRCCAVVGTRKPTPYGIAATHRIVEPLAQRGVTIVSGLAYGIDAEAHCAALNAKGATIAVLGNAINEVYPRSHTSLANNILDQGGAVISEYPPDTEVQKHFFPQRNRVIAGLSVAALIVEAGQKSGALITAKMALDENREVFAVPGPIDAETSIGTNDLIRQGASIATHPDDLIHAFGLDSVSVPRDNCTIRVETPEEQRLLPLLTAARHIDELVTLSTLDTSVVNATLSILEMKGRVRHLGGMNYIRIN